MAKMALVFSHTLTKPQQEEAFDRWGITQFISLPSNLQQIWSNLSPSELLPTALFIEWLICETEPDDIILIQGSFGITFSLVDWLLNNGRIPIYAATERCAVETIREDGSVQIMHVFKHVKFQPYERFKL